MADRYSMGRETAISATPRRSLRITNFADIGVRPAIEDTGRQHVTGSVNSAGQLGHRASEMLGFDKSFFHNGQFRTLQEVVAFYDRGGDFRSQQTMPMIHG